MIILMYGFKLILVVFLVLYLYKWMRPQRQYLESGLEDLRLETEKSRQKIKTRCVCMAVGAPELTDLQEDNETWKHITRSVLDDDGVSEVDVRKMVEATKGVTKMHLTLWNNTIAPANKRRFIHCLVESVLGCMGDVDGEP